MHSDGCHIETYDDDEEFLSSKFPRRNYLLYWC